MLKHLSFSQSGRPFPNKKLFLEEYNKNRFEKIAKVRSYSIEQKYLKKIEEGKCIKVNYYL